MPLLRPPKLLPWHLKDSETPKRVSSAHFSWFLLIQRLNYLLVLFRAFVWVHCQLFESVSPRITVSAADVGIHIFTMRSLLKDCDSSPSRICEWHNPLKVLSFSSILTWQAPTGYRCYAPKLQRWWKEWMNKESKQHISHSQLHHVICSLAQPHECLEQTKHIPKRLKWG